nr:MAG TPA: hypothetical protein [Bacteriophage sp.]
MLYHIFIYILHNNPRKNTTSFPNLSYPQTFLISYPSHPNHNSNFSTTHSPPRGILFPDKNIPKYHPVPSPTYTPKSITFSL